MMRIAEIAQQCSNSDTSMSGKLCMTQNSYTLSQCRTVCKEMFDLQVSACYTNSSIYNISTGYLNNPYCYFTRACVIMSLRKK